MATPQTEQPALFEGDGGKFKPGDVVRDPHTGRMGRLSSAVPQHPRWWVEWAIGGEYPGRMEVVLEAELEKVQP